MTQFVGILNVTPDSFSDGGQFDVPQKALDQAAKLFADGASLIDIGAESTRPNATPLTSGEEWQRLEPILSELLRRYPGRLSLDSYHPQTIENALNIGPVIVNDITGMNNPAMIELVCKRQPKVIISHSPGSTPKQAHEGVLIDNSEQVRAELLQKAKLLEAAGISRGNIILDPGIGFGKTPKLNRQLLSFAQQVPEYDVMIGYSRKRFLGEHRMDIGVNTAAGRVAVAHGAAYLRVHDVAGHIKALRRLG